MYHTDALADTLIRSLRLDGTIERVDDLPDRVGHNLLRINILKDPNAISMKALVINNGLLLANQSYTGNYLSRLIVKNNDARKYLKI